MPYSQRTYSLLMVLIITSMCAVPMIAAWYLYNHAAAGWHGHTVNHGHLIQPVRNALNEEWVDSLTGKPFKLSSLHGKWAMIYISPTPCEQTCQANLYKLKQIRLALGKYQDNIERVVISVDSGAAVTHANWQKLQQRFPSVIWLSASNQQIKQLLQGLPEQLYTLQQGGLFLLDPYGNLMMNYLNDFTEKAVYEDLNRLLNVAEV